MNPTVLDDKGFSSYQNKISFYNNTIITVKKICKKSSTRVHHGSSTTTTNRSYKVQCQSSPKVSHLAESRDELRLGPSRPLEGVIRCSANYIPLSPISLLERAAEVYRERTSVIYGSIKYTWEETYHRCIKLAYALSHLGISRGDVVAILAPNIPAMLELHFAVPMAGAIICALNTRLDPKMLSTQLSHSEAKILFVDHEFLQIAEEAITLLNNTQIKPPLLVIISEHGSFSPSTLVHKSEYETLVEEIGDTNFSIVRPDDECDPISLNYTSGTTLRPKGVVFSHRGAYLNSIACVFTHGMRDLATYLWTVPMFHSNGWCFSWGTAIVGGTNVFIRRCEPKAIFDNIVTHKVTHMCGAPTVLNMIANSLVTDQKKVPHTVEIMTGGAPPPPTILSKIEELGFHVCHIYGLTETYGPATWCLRKPEWDLLPVDEQVRLNARQGVKHFGMGEVDVKDLITMESVKCDGKSIGEIMFKGNTVMGGYFKDSRATQEAFSGGWFRSGDLGIKHPDGYIEVKDRSKDIIISGGENISSIEVETVIYSHPGVLEVAVVARPDDYWGQTPCAFVKLKEGVHVDAQEIIQYCRDHMSHYMVPRTVIFEDLPRNSTGKVQKFVLRKKAETLGSLT
ncbi:putative AMP-dependent synthetase/ligase, AMP-binding enzyme domain, ANL domain-containing protein [Helianthus annuus]|nr:putative AMP-dependent synthetase/ligase, AMP-binding enzyme domain, ANL domain-containing protein [Helianthus annuus]